eukprot:21357-Pelagomonas_calceolata.AAC.1
MNGSNWRGSEGGKAVLFAWLESVQQTHGCEPQGVWRHSKQILTSWTVTVQHVQLQGEVRMAVYGFASQLWVPRRTVRRWTGNLKKSNWYPYVWVEVPEEGVWGWVLGKGGLPITGISIAGVKWETQSSQSHVRGEGGCGEGGGGL